MSLAKLLPFAVLLQTSLHCTNLLATLYYMNRGGSFIERSNVFVIARLDNRLCKGFRRLSAYNIMHSLNISPMLPRGEKPRQSVGKSVLEGGYNDAACTARHALHIAENESCSNAVCLSSSTACDNNGGISTDKLGKALR